MLEMQQEGHTQYTCPQREGRANTPRYTQHQISTEKQVACEEPETKQHYAARIRDMAQQAELKALQERLSKAHTEVQTNALTIVKANALQVHPETERSETVPVTGGMYLLDLYVGGFE